MPRDAAPIAFLFLGETLLVPHLAPIMDRLAALRPDLRIDAWVRSDDVEAMLSPGLNVRLRRTPRWPKLPVLARIAPALGRSRVAVCAEQTSLWLPRVLPMRTRFIKTSHGVGSMSARDDPRRRAAWRMLVPSELERQSYLKRGYPPEKIVATGYVKASYRSRQAAPAFPAVKPIILYTPHWQRHRSSWWDWGRQIVRHLAEQDGFNVILAPHQRLIERDPAVREALAAVAALPHVHVDLGSVAMVDGSYTAAADIYLGDTSSQVVEFLIRPRPCIFLNPQKLNWRATDDHEFWTCGEVIDDLGLLGAALASAQERHAEYREVQADFAARSLGDTSGIAPDNAARVILQALEA